MDQLDVFAVVTPQLRAGEEIIWADRPAPMARASTKKVYFLFGIPFFSFAIFWVVASATMGAGVFSLFGIPFILIGAGLVLSPVWSYWEAKNWLVYAITDQRLLIIRTFRQIKVETFEPSDIQRVTRTSKADGSGDVIFSEEIYQDDKGGLKVPRGFFGVPEAKRVEEAIMALRSSIDE